jgi:hypothetical protein
MGNPMRYLPLLLLMSCTDSAFTGTEIDPPPDAASGDYFFQPSGGEQGFASDGSAWHSDSRLQVRLNERPVRNAVLRYRATMGHVTPASDTSDVSGYSEYLWGIGLEPLPAGQGELFVCVVVGTECTEFRLTGIEFTPR